MDNHDFQIEEMKHMISKSDSTEAEDLCEFFRELLSIEGVAPQGQFDVYQYVFRAKYKK
jgi:hypothetical protein